MTSEELIAHLTTRDQRGRGILQLATLCENTDILAGVILFSRRFFRVGKVCRFCGHKIRTVSVVVAEGENCILTFNLSAIFLLLDRDAAATFPESLGGTEQMFTDA